MSGERIRKTLTDPSRLEWELGAGFDRPPNHGKFHIWRWIWN